MLYISSPAAFLNRLLQRQKYKPKQPSKFTYSVFTLLGFAA